VTVGDVSRTGEGTSKKTAEMAAALSVWRTLSERA
jgi:ribonuclease-3